MSIISHRPRGGQDGIEVTRDELFEFSTKLGSNILDGAIPLPGLSFEKQQERMMNCDHECDAEYWEMETVGGSHGWCCANCGKVVQWG